MTKEIMRFRPFLFVYVDHDGNKCHIIFKCQKCGSSNAVKIIEPCGINSFWSGFFMCADCGTSLCDGDLITYYSSCFSKEVFSCPIQLKLF